MIDCLIQLTRLDLHQIMQTGIYEALHWYSYAIAKNKYQDEQYKRTQAKLTHR